MRFNAHYGTHLPVLMKAVLITSGDVLELGMGAYSTPVLHWMCVPQKRYLLSCESDAQFVDKLRLRQYVHEYHQIVVTDDWDSVDLDREWDVVLVDHGPAERRKVEVARLKDRAKYIIIHDSDWRNNKYYHFPDIYPLFKYRWDYRDHKPGSSILSNLIDVRNFHV